MNISATIPLPMPPTHVWQCLTNPEHLSRCLPGLISWQEVVAQRCYALQLSWHLGPTTPIQLPVIIEWTSLQPPHTLVQKAEVTFKQEIIAVDCTVNLVATPQQQTELTFFADITVPNKFLEQIIRNTAPKAIDKFFVRFKKVCVPISTNGVATGMTSTFDTHP